MWFVVLIGLLVLGWMLYAAGRRHAAQEVLSAIDEAEVLNNARLADELERPGQVMSDVWEEVAVGAAKKGVLVATGGESSVAALARLRDQEILRGVNEAIQTGMGPHRSKLPSGFEMRAFHIAIWARDNARRNHEGRWERAEAIVLLAQRSIDKALLLCSGRKPAGDLSDLEVATGVDFALDAESKKPPTERLPGFSPSIKDDVMLQALTLRNVAAKA